MPCGGTVLLHTGCIHTILTWQYRLKLIFYSHETTYNKVKSRKIPNDMAFRVGSLSDDHPYLSLTIWSVICFEEITPIPRGGVKIVMGGIGVHPKFKAFLVITTRTFDPSMPWNSIIVSIIIWWMIHWINLDFAEQAEHRAKIVAQWNWRTWSAFTWRGVGNHGRYVDFNIFVQLCIDDAPISGYLKLFHSLRLNVLHSYYSVPDCNHLKQLDVKMFITHGLNSGNH